MTHLPGRERRLGGNVRGRPHVRRALHHGRARAAALNRPRSRSRVVSGGYLVAALVAGRLGDRVGLAPVIVVASLVYGGGYMAGGLATEWHDWYLPVIFPIAIAGGIVMTLAWGLLFKLMPQQHRGAISGLATTTKGLGLLIGPLVAGAAIDILRPHLESTDGYQVLWPICGLPVLAVVPLVARLIPSRGEWAVSERLDSRIHELEEKPRPFTALYEHWERNQWSLFDLDFNVDAESYARLDDEAAQGLRWIFAHRFDAEWEVARLLPPFVVAAPDYEVQLVLATQLSDEHRHLQAVLRVYNEVFGVHGFARGAGAVRPRTATRWRRASTASSRATSSGSPPTTARRSSSAPSSPTTCSPKASSPARRRTSRATSTRASGTSRG